MDQSSYEPHPLGRTEWIKVYGALTGRAAQAEAVFDEQTDYLDALTGLDNTGKTVAFFYISSVGFGCYAKVRRLCHQDD